MLGVKLRYDELAVGVGAFPGRVCEDDRCADRVTPASVYFEAQGEPGHYLCATHFAAMVEWLVAFHTGAAVEAGSWPSI